MLKLRIASTCLVLLVATSAEATLVFIQPTNLVWSGVSDINTPAVLVGNVTSQFDSHPNPVSGGGGTSWHDAGYAGHSLVFDFSTPSNLVSFHLWDYYLHTNNVLGLTLYDATGGTGTTLYNVVLTIVPGPDGGGSKRHDIALPPIVGALSGRITPISEIADNYGGFGLAEIGFVAAVPETSALACVGFAGSFAGIASLAWKRRRARRS